MTRTVYVVDHEFPPTSEDMQSAQETGAAEVVCGIPPALAAAGVEAFGFHEITDPPDEVPRSVSMRQARLALLNAGLLPTVQHYIEAADEPTKIEWQYATELWRDRDLVSGIGSALALTSNQIDALFIAAEAIL